MSYLITTPPKFGRVLQVDDIYGNDSTGRPGEAPFKTVAAAVSASVSGDTIWVSPGTYNLAGGITMKDGTALRGMSTQTTTLQMTGVLGNTTLWTMGENCRLEDITLNLTSNDHHNLTGIAFPGTTSVTSKVRPSVINVNNAAAGDTPGGTSNVYGAHCSGSGSLGAASFTFNSLKGLTINVLSAGSGSKRGIYVSGPGAITTRDINLYVSGSSTSPGTFYGAEVDNSSGQVQFRTSTIFGTTADICQSSGSIQLGPGTDLVNKTAAGKNFTTYVYPTTLWYGTIGSMTNTGLTPNFSVYLMPGASTIQASQSIGGRTFYQYPDSNINYYAIQQKSVCFGLFVSSSVGPGVGNTTKVVVMKNGVDTAITGTITDGILASRYYDSSVDLAQFDKISLRCEISGATNATHDLWAQVDLF
ncbi:MAG: DUF1565 domain-containing protein [Caulobacteraceae bacterium]|nr:DUF1565 domain-containing protein [Caulobacteraceae bacterium]